MDFGSIRRKNRISQQSSRRKAISSSSNLSCISCNSASISRKAVYVTLPKDFGCDVDLEGRIVHIRKGGAAHAVGIMQIGDYLRIVDDEESGHMKDGESDNLIKLQVIFGVLQADTRPNCPLVVEIGNRSNTSLGIALVDTEDSRIQINSIQPGSLAERCGYLQPGDILWSLTLNSNETIYCSPLYTSFEIAQIMKRLTSQCPSVKMTIIPYSYSPPSHLPRSLSAYVNDLDTESGGSNSTLTLGESDTSNNAASHNNNSSNFSTCPSFMVEKGLKMQSLPTTTNKVGKRQIEKVDEMDETESGFVVSLCLWKDPMYEDWGFSLVDRHPEAGESSGPEAKCDMDISGDENVHVESEEVAMAKLLHDNGSNETCHKRKDGAIVFQIRPGGPAFVAGLRPTDRIVQINGQDVSDLESTMLVPILASLEEVLNLVILRNPLSNDCC